MVTADGSVVRTGHDAPRLICLIGAECTGKTTLAQALARQFGGLMVPEALRGFVERHGRTPRQDEQRALIDAQVALEEQAMAQAAQHGKGLVFCDTVPLLIAVYSAHYFADTSLVARGHALQRRYAFTLFLQPDLPWLADGRQRDGVAVQQQVHALLQLQLADTAVAVIRGQGAARQALASQLLRMWLASVGDRRRREMRE